MADEPHKLSLHPGGDVPQKPRSKFNVPRTRSLETSQPTVLMYQYESSTNLSFVQQVVSQQTTNLRNIIKLIDCIVMAPARIEEPPVSWETEVDSRPTKFKGFPRNVATIDAVKFDDSLQPKQYEIFGTHPESKILFLDVNIIDSTGREPYHGDVLIEGEKFQAVGEVPDIDQLKADPKVRVFHGRRRTLISGLGDAHTHFTWNGGDLDRLGDLGVEEHTLLTMRSAQCFLDSGYTMCFGAASAKKRLDVVIRDAINAGDIPGPRYLANGQEIAVPDGELVGGITAFASGPDEMRSVIRQHVDVGVDNVKLSMSGEEITEIRSAQDCYFSDEETAACVDEAHKLGKSLCAHARARDSVKMCQSSSYRYE
ncbi:hypothetical protein LTR22_012772 [Elasticomyces elasticus]|nr:hypothetical protein LTR22_012772 [Elasticomyces elasticus]KAK4918153.1 hypothetical protein LTR49_014009 [Elasticomyces elasticus]KAK5757699.1 hypothetical protein LTS12_012158 [Elasticomyces elasticus]